MRSTVVREAACSRRCTSVAPGWVPSTSLSRSTTGGVQRTTGSEMTTGPRGPSDRSGSESSIAISLGTSSRRSRRPLTTTTASSASEVANRL